MLNTTKNNVKKNNLNVIGVFLCVLFLYTIIYLYYNNKTTETFVIPALKPPLKAVIPSGFDETNRRLLINGPENEIKERFFNGEGPTNIYHLLGAIDNRTQSINKRSTETSKHCLSLTSTPIEITGWPSKNITIWVQCYEQIGNDLFILFGKKGNVVYLYERGLASTVLAITTINHNVDHSNEFPCCYDIGINECNCNNNTCINNGNNGNTDSCRTSTFLDIQPDINNNITLNVTVSTLPETNIYFSVGGNWDPDTESGSRGLMHLVAAPQNNYFQATVAGIGLGFCGAQFASNSDKILFIGSQDGVNGSCQTPNTTCLSADLGTIYDIDSCTQNIGFSMLPLGRKTSSDYLGEHNISLWAHSLYPGVSMNNVDISDDDFGPSTIPMDILSIKNKFI